METKKDFIIPITHLDMRRLTVEIRQIEGLRCHCRVWNLYGWSVASACNTGRDQHADPAAGD